MGSYLEAQLATAKKAKKAKKPAIRQVRVRRLDGRVMETSYADGDSVGQVADKCCHGYHGKFSLAGHDRGETMKAPKKGEVFDLVNVGAAG